MQVLWFLRSTAAFKFRHPFKRIDNKNFLLSSTCHHKTFPIKNVLFLILYKNSNASNYICSQNKKKKRKKERGKRKTKKKKTGMLRLSQIVYTNASADYKGPLGRKKKTDLI